MYTRNAGEFAIWTYNDSNLVTSSNENGITKTYTYNEDGQMLTCTTDGSGTVTYAYENGNVVKYENTIARVTECEVDAGGSVLCESAYMEMEQKRLCLIWAEKD